MKDGIIYTKSLELDSLEVQFVRGIRMDENEAREVGAVAKEADVELHVHSPYYTNLAGDDANVEMSLDKVFAAANLANEMHAKIVVVHPGFYGDLTPEETMVRVVHNARRIRDEFTKRGYACKLGLETMGKKAVFGTLEEIHAVCKAVPGIVPVIDFGHIHARGNGSLVQKEDFQAVFDKLADLKLEHYLIHFTGVLYEDGNERHHLPIKKGDLRFEPLVDVILDNEYNVTLISESPILEHDAMYMQIVFDRVKEKREQKQAKEAEEREKAAKKLVAVPAAGPQVVEPTAKAEAPRIVKKVARPLPAQPTARAAPALNGKKPVTLAPKKDATKPVKKESKPAKAAPKKPAPKKATSKKGGGGKSKKSAKR